MKTALRTDIISSLDPALETQAFTVNVTPKTFKVLLDTLYTNKVRAVIRELWTNAYDAHVEAGCPYAAFECSLPTSLSPTFAVRDFGCSMTHDEVMHLYSTVFASSKEDTNEQVGYLGLGSKSPFAYTDSFTVTAWRDGEKRSYLAALDTTGVPTITHLGSEPSSEPRGVRVSFPVESHHRSEFTTEARKVSAGFSVKPIIDGGNLGTAPEPILSGSDWSLFAEGEHSIRQGCVLYPARSAVSWQDVAVDGALVIDVPIGTADGTANREALSLDDTTRDRVRQAFKIAGEECLALLRQRVQDQSTLLDAEKAYLDLRRHSKSNQRNVVWNTITLTGSISIPKKANPPIVTDSRWTPRPANWSVASLESLVFVIDRPDQRVFRRKLRVKKYADSLRQERVEVLIDPTAKQLRRLIRALGLKPEQIVPIANVPDVHVQRKPRDAAPTKSLAGVYDLSTQRQTQTLGDDWLWVPIERKTDHAYVLDGIGTIGRYSVNEMVRWVCNHLDPTFLSGNRQIVLLTKTAAKRLKADEARSLAAALKRSVRANLPKFVATKKASEALMVLRAGIPDEVCDELLAEVGTDSRSTFPIPPWWVESLLKPELDEAAREIAEWTDGIITSCPLLFRDSDPDAVRDYIKTQRSNECPSTTP